ncbi:putative bacteriophage protein [Shigella sonnei]|nr:putative bacteriophage protein [Shigella sonnei]
MEIKPEDELSNIVLFPVKEDNPRNQVNFLYEPSERPYCHHASVRVDEKERQVRCKICGAGNDSNLLIVFYVQIMPDDFVMQLHRF